ncbi:MAG: tripartite tricarboxylate transporter TctB family protein [Acidobacteriota bacterium]|nr:tripartite tricarboxylate transporter TctB family protein [Acidobacteriota bacterium]
MTAFNDVVAGSVVILLGIVLALGALGVSTGFGYDRIGPRTAPYGVAVGLMLVGGALVVGGLRRRVETTTALSLSIRWEALSLLVLGGVVFLALAERVGFILAASLQFWLVARSFSLGHPFRDATVAVVLTVVVYVVFSRGLGLALPSGLIESAIALF